MPAIIRLPKKGGSIRLGPDCHKWGDPYEHALSFEIEDGGIAVIGGLDWSISRIERNWVIEALVKAGFKPVMERIKNGTAYRVELSIKKEI